MVAPTNKYTRCVGFCGFRGFCSKRGDGLSKGPKTDNPESRMNAAELSRRLAEDVIAGGAITGRPATKGQSMSKLTNLQRLIVLGAIGTDERRRAIQAQSNLRAWWHGLVQTEKDRLLKSLQDAERQQRRRA